MTSVDYTYKVQVRSDHRRFWQTKYAVANAAQAHLLYEGINIGNGWCKRLMERDKCIRQASSA